MPGNGHTKKENRGIPRGTEQSNKPLKERKKENGKDHNDVRDCAARARFSAVALAVKNRKMDLSKLDSDQQAFLFPLSTFSLKISDFPCICKKSAEKFGHIKKMLYLCTAFFAVTRRKANMFNF